VPDLSFFFWRTQKIGRMVGANHLDTLIIQGFTSKMTYWIMDAKQGVSGSGSEATNNLRAKDAQLSFEKRSAVEDFLRCWGAVARRTAFEGVEDVNLIPREA
jgi:hypothetical protein